MKSFSIEKIGKIINNINKNKLKKYYNNFKIKVVKIY